MDMVGVAINSSAADGLVSCGDQMVRLCVPNQINIEFSKSRLASPSKQSINKQTHIHM